jgi:hypothetical protein
MVKTTCYSKTAVSLVLFVPVGILLVLSPHYYVALELLVCWLFFGLFLLAITPAVLGAVLAYYAGRRIIRWAWTTPGILPTTTLVAPEGRSTHG